ncbi:hypothetical protein MBLNU457_g2431t1 [Dothideomycetes sp. NU457]
MRLLETSGDTRGQYVLRFKEFHNPEDVKYAILSHAWDEEEILFADVINRTAHSKKGFKKVVGAMKEACKNGLEYIWIDTCCIDKTSSAELSEAINSMYLWYKNATVCYAYLADVPWRRRLQEDSSSRETSMVDITSSRWFTRGWTLQELLAPNRLDFFSQEWRYLGTKIDYSESIYQATKIDIEFLLGIRPLGAASIAKRMHWSARRQTTRPEDLAYCMMGIFSVNMPLLYGEGGQKAFHRLQEEIIRNSDDESLFAWADRNIGPGTCHGLLADHPSAFDYDDASSIVAYTKRDYESLHGWNLTNRGLNIELYMKYRYRYGCREYIAALNCPDPREDQTGYIGIRLWPHDPWLPLERLQEGYMPGSKSLRFSRISCNELFSVGNDNRGSAQSMLITSGETRLYLQTESMIMSSGVEGSYLQTDILPSHRFRLRLQDASLSKLAENYIVDSYVAHDAGRMPLQVAGRGSIDAFPGSKEIPDLEIIRRHKTLAGAYLITHKQDEQHIAIMLGSIEPFSLGFNAVYMDSLAPFEDMAEHYLCPKPITGSTRHAENDPPWVYERTTIELAMHTIQITARAHVRAQVKVYELEVEITYNEGWYREMSRDERQTSKGHDGQSDYDVARNRNEFGNGERQPLERRHDQERVIDEWNQAEKNYRERSTKGRTSRVLGMLRGKSAGR